jgi:hypothetical protein
MTLLHYVFDLVDQVKYFSAARAILEELSVVPDASEPPITVNPQ